MSLDAVMIRPDGVTAMHRTSEVWPSSRQLSLYSVVMEVILVTGKARERASFVSRVRCQGSHGQVVYVVAACVNFVNFLHILSHEYIPVLCTCANV